MKRIFSLEKILAIAIAAGGVGAGCSDDNITGDDGGDVHTDADAATDDAYTNHAPDPIDVSSMTPADGTAYNVGDRIPVGFDVPNDSDGDSLTGVIHVTGDSDAVAGPSAGDYTNSVDLGSLTPGARLTHDINTATAGPSGAALPTRADGTQTPYALEIIVSDGRGGESRLSRNVGLNGGSANPARVTGCYVVDSAVGAGLAINCRGESSAGTITGWDLTGGPIGAIITGSGAIATMRGLDASDVDNHTYNVTCTDGTNTSDVYTFTVPVDEHISKINTRCSTGTRNSLRLPETSVDAVALACGYSGFNPANKPSAAGPVYTLDVDPSCVQGVISGLHPDEIASHENYNNGTTVSDVYSSCTVDNVNVEYTHH